MRSLRLLLGSWLAASLSVAACVDSSDVPPYGGEAPDSSTPLCETSGACSDGAASVRDAPSEAAGDDGAPAPDGSDDALTDASRDASTTDGTVADALVSDATVTDSSDADSGGGVTDSSVEAATDASSFDAGVDATVTDAASPVDSGPDSGCVLSVWGDHYLRRDGTVASMKSSPHTVVTSFMTGLPLQTVTYVLEQSDHACALLADQTVWCWPFAANGGNANGDLGNGVLGGATTAYVATQVVTQPADSGANYLIGVTALQSGSNTVYAKPTCAIRADKSLWCWGFSTAQGSGPDGLFWGTTGSRSSVPYAIPIVLAPATDGGAPTYVSADQVAVGDRHACYTRSGQAYCWGQNIAGNLGNGDATLAFQAYPKPVVPGLGLSTAVDEIVAGYDFTCARSGGKFWCFGSNNWNQVGNPYVANQICNLNYCEPQPTPVQASLADAGPQQTDLSGMTALIAGYQFSCGLDGVGSLWCWGAVNGGVSSQKEAAPYASLVSLSVPTSNIVHFSAAGGDINSSLRYVTSNGTLVSSHQVVTPLCP